MANVLIVDDTPDTCAILKRVFAHWGHASHCLYGGADVVDALRASPPFDLVVLDVMMPDVDGFRVLDAIRADADPAVANVPVAMYSAMSDPAHQERALAAGANEWIVKGTPFPLLRQRLANFLQKGGQAAVGGVRA